MIRINFYDLRGKFVCSHKIEFVGMCNIKMWKIECYISYIFRVYENAGSADVFYNGGMWTKKRYE